MNRAPPIPASAPLRLRRGVALALLAVGASSGLPRQSWAQQAGTASPLVRTTWTGAVPRVTLGYHELFDPETLQRMRSGLEVTVVMRAWAIPEAGGEAVGFAARSCRVSFDVWEQNYRVEVLDPAGLRTVALPDTDAVISQCGQVAALPLRMTRALRAAERFHVATVAEIDPLTADMVAQIQRWIARPGEAGSDASDAPGGSFFGSFVAFFVNPTVGEAERTLRLDSGPQVAP